MTVTYTADVASCRSFGTFVKILFRWRGSIYKLMWKELVFYLIVYYSLNMTYRKVMNAKQKSIFEQISRYCSIYSNGIPLAFILGFYVTTIAGRCWNQYENIPRSDPFAYLLVANLHGSDERGRLMRRSAMRYVCLSITIFRCVSNGVFRHTGTMCVPVC